MTLEDYSPVKIAEVEEWGQLIFLNQVVLDIFKKAYVLGVS